MKILYQVSSPYGMGADRWIYEGYKDAFLAEGHNFFTLTETDNFESCIRKTSPDILMLDFGFVESHKLSINLDFLKQMKNRGMKIFALAGTAGIDKELSSPEKIAICKQYAQLIDIWYSNYAPEVTDKFELLFGKPLYFIPHAANTRYYFPEKPDPRFVCDIAFVGSFYTQKKKQFETLLFPLLKKYNVKIYGTGWTLKDRISRLCVGFSRALKIPRVARLINASRLTISPDQERKLYATAKICINLHEYYKDGTTKGFSNEREFKVPASGGFQISDYIPGMDRYFEIGKEIVVAKNSQEWFEKIDYYLKHDQERKEIQQRGTERVLREHTYRHRVKQLIELYNSLKDE